MMMFWDTLLMPKRCREEPTVPTSEHDNRTPFKKDFDAVCNSTALRRLQDKAQVFPLEDEDYARTRLTHSIETMSIAESLGLQVMDIIKAKKDYWSKDRSPDSEQKTLPLLNEIPTILKTAALLHDMGNPPFGHLGEQIIGDWFDKNLDRLYFNDGLLVFQSTGSAKSGLANILGKEFKDEFVHFDGNAQLLRTVSKLNLIVDEYGMNLTYPVMATFIKYPIPPKEIDPSNPLKKKPGYFFSEKEIFEDIEMQLGLNYNRHPLAFLLEAADDVAYLTADIEDAHHKGLLSLYTIRDYLNKGKDDPFISDVLGYMEGFEEKAKELGYEDVENYVLHRTRVLIKGLMINSIHKAFENSYEKIMRGEFKEELIKVSTASKIADLLKKMEKENIYYSPQILKNKTRAYAVIENLLNTYVPVVVNWTPSRDNGKDTADNLIFQSFSKNYRYMYEQEIKGLDAERAKEKVLYYKLHLVTDQISGMTDTHALSVYRTLTAH